MAGPSGSEGEAHTCQSYESHTYMHTHTHAHTYTKHTQWYEKRKM